MNGCQGDHPELPLGTVETRSFPAVSSPPLAVEALSSAVSQLQANPPPYTSGIIRLHVSNGTCFCALFLSVNCLVGQKASKSRAMGSCHVVGDLERHGYWPIVPYLAHHLREYMQL